MVDGRKTFRSVSNVIANSKLWMIAACASAPPAAAMRAHSCLVAARARLESKISLERLLEFMPRYEVQWDGCKRVNMQNVAGWNNVSCARSTLIRKRRAE